MSTFAPTQSVNPASDVSSTRQPPTVLSRLLTRALTPVVVAAAANLLLLGSASATDRDWNKPSGTQVFNTGTNWDPNGTPAAGDNLTFGLDGDVDIYLGAMSLGNNITFTDGVVEFLSAGGAMLNSGGVVTIDDALAAGLGDGAQVALNGQDGASWDSAGDATIGDEGYGMFTINNGGGFEANRVFIGGDQFDGVGEVTVTGPGSTLNVSLNSNVSLYRVGFNGGTGTLNVWDGADLTTTSTTQGDISLGEGLGSTGTLGVDGAGSFAEAEDVVVGHGGTGYLNITNGGHVELTDGTNPDVWVGLADNPVTGNGSGTVMVDGSGSELNVDNARLGEDGVASVTISGGGLIHSAGFTTIGELSSSTGSITTVTGSGSLLDVGTTLTVGDAGQGTLNVEMGGHVTVGTDLAIGATSTDDNTVTVDGAGSTVGVTGAIKVGDSGKGILHISSGGAVTVAGGFSAGDLPNSDGTVSMDGLGSQVTVNNCCLYVAREGTGSLTISGGALAQSNAYMDVAQQGNADGTVTVTGSDNGTPSKLEINDRLDLGGDPDDTGGTGTLNIFEGGQVTVAAELFFAAGPGSTGTIEMSGTGSSLETNGAFFLGNKGVGTMNVNAGTSVTSTEVDMANEEGGTGVANIDGNGATWSISGELLVGEFGVGTLNVTNGGVVHASTGGNSNLQIGVDHLADGSSVVVDGNGSLLDHQGTGRLSVGNVGGSGMSPATLTVTGGGHVSTQNFFVADGAGSVADVQVDGAGSRVDARTEVTIGDDGNGTATIENGGVIAAQADVRIGGHGSAGVGTVTVDGAGSQLTAGTTLSVADLSSSASMSTLNIRNGGTVTNSGIGFIARQAGNVGIVNVGGAGDTATWNIGSSLFVGGSDTAAGGTGTLNVNVGGTVDVTSSLALWYNGTVNLNGGTIETGELLLAEALSAPFPAFNWTNGTFRLKGNQNLNMETLDDLLGTAHTLGAGQHLAVVGSATLSTPLRMNHVDAAFSVGSISAADMAANFDFDAGTFNLTSDNLTVGAGGLFGSSLVINPQQAINITNQATINFGAKLVAAGGFSSGQLTNNGDLVATDATIGGALVNNSNVTVVGMVDFDGLVSGPGDFFGPGTANFHGGLAPGASPAEVAFDGNVSLANTNTLFIEIAGATLGDDYDSLRIAGSADLDGLLSVSLDNFTPSSGQQFTILTASNIVDNGIVLGGSAAGSFDLLVNGTSVILQAVGLLGDYNHDGTVNAADYVVWRKTGIDGQQGYDTWRAHFGKTTGGSGTGAATNAAVPEPTTYLLLMFGVAGWCLRRSRAA